MSLYELSIDDAHLREAERLTSLEGRGFPTLVTRWESRLFDQPWSTTLVLDYTIPLPPLPASQQFIEVRIAAYVGGAPTKFLYFGTEMNSSVPRIGPEMENQIGWTKQYQEYRLDEHTSPVPYLKLIQTTPRIYGAGAQDYYSPAIKVERYDGTASSDHLADLFPTVVANLPCVKGHLLTDPSAGLWNGARYVGQTAIAILRQGKVVGIHRRIGRTDKDAVPPEIKRRDPKLDVLKEWVSIDLGSSTTVVALRGDRSAPELVRIGATSAPVVSADYENPSEISFEQLGRTLKAWRDRVILPMTRWGEVSIGHAARAARKRGGEETIAISAATLTHLPMLRERVDRKEKISLRGRGDPETQETLKKPAPPIIDEDGIGAHDPFDPIELYAYYIGLHVNHRTRGIHTRYLVAMPSGWSDDRRKSALVAVRRGIFRSLPAGMLEFHDMDMLNVVDAGPAAIPFAAFAFRAFAVQPKPDPVPFVAIDAGASETGVVYGLFRNAKPDEQMEGGYERMIEYLDPTSIPWFGGERLLHRLAYRLYVAAEASVGAARVPFDRPSEETPVGALEHLLIASPEGRANAEALKDAIRPLLEGGDARMPKSIKLATLDGPFFDFPLEVDRQSIAAEIDGWFSEAVEEVRVGLEKALEKIGRDPDPYDGLRVMLGGRMSMHPALLDKLTATLPKNVKIHRFIEPDRLNLGAPTVKTACALGALAMKFERIGANVRAEKRDAFKYRVGRNRHGQLADVLDPAVEYDVWREVGACTKPNVEVLYMRAEDDGEVAADDPRVEVSICKLGATAVGQRIYMRAVGPIRVEVSVGPPGGEPAAGAPVWWIDLKENLARPKA
ncbi:hypothetical protein [Polyangium spumosum]|uniref:Uncharacterized protein n=1 Tax=Polyangium spumosum TaxID=889282 RepID=A0A6N7PJX7_9BACT|nr:hypothetical protein [Polyangium spumosum]MRG90510.1 hypothetical protein [Polyangium spumosum]